MAASFHACFHAPSPRRHCDRQYCHRDGVQLHVQIHVLREHIGCTNSIRLVQSTHKFKIFKHLDENFKSRQRHSGGCFSGNQFQSDT